MKKLDIFMIIYLDFIIIYSINKKKLFLNYILNFELLNFFFIYQFKKMSIFIEKSLISYYIILLQNIYIKNKKIEII